jgi:hypothetical protein
MHWDGNAWSLSDPANPNPNSNARFNGVACGAFFGCWTAGYWRASSFEDETLVEKVDGTPWSITPSQNRAFEDYFRSNYLNAVTCPSPAECWAVGYSNLGTVGKQTLIERFTTSAVAVMSIVSRKNHAGTDYNVDLTNGGIECRSGGPNGDYTLVFTFSSPIANCGTANNGTVTSGPDSNECTVQLTGVANAQYTSMSLTGVVDANGNPAAATGTLPLLLGDTNEDGVVNSADIAQTKSRSGQSVGASNFREDVTADDSINSADIALVKSKSGTALP